jgi:hypothetical protein
MVDENDKVWSTDQNGNPIQVDTSNKKISEADIEYVKRMDVAIKGKQEEQQKEQQPPKEPLRKKIQSMMQGYIQKKQKQIYETKVEDTYNLNFYVQNSNGSWSFWKTVNKLSKEQVNNARRELQKNKVIFREMEGNVQDNLGYLNTYTGRLTKKFTENAKEIPKQLDKTSVSVAGEISDTMTPNVDAQIPRMGIQAFGSMNYPSDLKAKEVPAYGSVPKPKRRYINHQEYQSLIDQGYTKENLDASSVFDKQSPYYQEQSVFSKYVVPYRPVSFGQSFVRCDPPRTEYSKRLERGEQYQPFKPLSVNPMVLGQLDPITGQRQTSIRPVFAQSKNFSFPYVFKPDQLTGARTWFTPVPVSSVTFSPMKQEITYDVSGNVIRVRKTFYKPPMSRL